MTFQVDANHTRNTLQEVANQAYNLAMGLQNAAPALVTQSATGTSKSVQYLLETSLQINKVSKMIEESGSR
ncbi:MAG TPA: hypothetical protein VLJ15_05475 [Gammaproteobacteria bacterium]|nr:hypothetical protein [Gammaproteobacteria bacterium]